MEEIERANKKTAEWEDRLQKLEKREVDKEKESEREIRGIRKEVGSELECIKRSLEIEEKKEEKNDIVVKGMKTIRRRGIEEVERMFKDVLKVETEPGWVNVRGIEDRPIVIVGLENWEDKKKIIGKDN